jgi:acylphosphatase
MLEHAMQRLDVTVTGRVQGVAFRWHTRQTALRLGLTGWVRNQPDGSVRLVAEGPPPQLEQLLAWVRLGPDRAHVAQCRHVWREATGGFSDFEITG